MTGNAEGYRFDTLAIHAGQEPDSATGAVIPPISLSTTFQQSSVGVHRVALLHFSFLTSVHTFAHTCIRTKSSLHTFYSINLRI